MIDWTLQMGAPQEIPRRSKFLAIEARCRVEQAYYALHRFHDEDLAQSREFTLVMAEHDAWYRDNPGRVMPIEMIKAAQARTLPFGLSLPFYAEAFYYFAHRAMKALRGIDGFPKFDVPVIRDIRNHLIEHPLTLGRNFVFGDPRGFVLKPQNAESVNGTKDRGLYPNAEAFLQDLQRVLPRQLNADKS